MATLLQIIQGVIAGVSILATTVAILYTASLGGVGINLVLDGEVIEIIASSSVASAAESEEAAMAKKESPQMAVSVPTPATQVVAAEKVDAFQLTQPPTIPPTAVLDYYDLIAPDVSAAVISLGRLSQLLENPRAQEEGWRTDVTQLIDIVADSYERLIRVRPPSDAVAIHSFLIDSTGRCLGITEALSGDLTQVPEDLFPVIGKTLQRCTGETKSVVQQVY
ncbi:hypothetical protein GC175_09500 [bacterium]|nr:hypothetical protein [bacterium]